MSKSPYADGLFMLDNLLDGKALPPHLARSRAGLIVHVSPGVAKQRQTTDDLRAKNEAIAKEAAAKITKAPLEAVCFNHKCKCGATWQGFGYFCRQVTQSISGAADATFTKRLDYDPRPEVPAAILWQDVEEEFCLKCFNPTTSATPWEFHNTRPADDREIADTTGG